MNASMLPIGAFVIGLLQGFLLYGLHYAFKHGLWPGTSASWWLPLYGIVLFAPVMLQMLVRELRNWRLWAATAAIAALITAMGVYSVWSWQPLVPPDFYGYASFYSAVFVVWFIALPFIQTWIRRGEFRLPYRDLFEFSWQNPLMLLEAAIFSAVVWGLLGLWAALFKVVNISFFADLFSEPAFSYPLTTVAFGLCLYLIQSRENIVITVRRHVLGVFSWLMPLVATIAVLFVLVLPATGLAPLWKTGYATFLMLCLQLLFIHFLNAAYDDGEKQPVYPVWMRHALRIAVFSMPVYAALCIYSLGLRVDQYGWTVQRVWAGLITMVFSLYGVGYAYAALNRRSWMGPIARINVPMAVVVAVLVALAHSPIVDPKRISADSQVGRLGDGKQKPATFDYDYLRFHLGRYGAAALEKLSRNSDAEIAKLAAEALKKTARVGATPEQRLPLPATELAKRLDVFPRGAKVDPEFLAFVESSGAEQLWLLPNCLRDAKSEPCLVIVQDLNGDGQAEILIVGSFPQSVFSKVDGKWKKAANIDGPAWQRTQLRSALEGSLVAAVPPPWPDLRIGDQRFVIRPAAR